MGSRLAIALVVVSAAHLVTPVRARAQADTWADAALAPSAALDGASLAFAGGDLVYALRGGGTQDFRRYSIADGAWAALPALPGAVSTGGALAYPGAGNRLFAFRGSLTRDFWRYSIPGAAWVVMSPAPQNVGTGGALSRGHGGDSLYAFRGDGTGDFWRYTITADAWTVLAPAPAMVGAGASLVHPGTGDDVYALRGGGSSAFWRYSISGNSWSALAPAPWPVGVGGSLVYPGGGDDLYSLGGGSTDAFGRYSISAGLWTALAVPPQVVAAGGALSPGGGNHLYAFPGGSTRFLVYQLRDTIDFEGAVLSAAGAPMAGVPVRLRVQGTSEDLTLSAASGEFTASAAPWPGDVLTIHLDGDPRKGATAMVSDGGALIGILVREGYLSLRSDGALQIGTTHLDVASRSGDPDLTALYSVAGSTLSTTTATTLSVECPFEPMGDVQVAGTLRIPTGGRFRLASGRTLLISRNKAAFPPDVHPVAGTLELEGGDGATPTKVRLGDHQQLQVDGSLATVHEETPSFPGNRFVLFEATGAGGYSVHFRPGSLLDISFVRFDRLYGSSGASGELDLGGVQSAMAISSGGAGVLGFSQCWFRDLVPGGGEAAGYRHDRYVYLLGDVDADGTTDFSFDGAGSLEKFHRLRFDESSACSYSGFNVEKNAPGDVIRFVNGGGTRNGEAYDLDGDATDGFVGTIDPGVDDVVFGSAPTAVKLVELTATAAEASTLVEWTTAQEVENLGFNVYRSLDPAGGWLQVNEALILALGDSMTGGRYAFVDRLVASGVQYYYVLEDVDVRGERTLHGPVAAVGRLREPSPVVVAPSIVTLATNAPPSSPWPASTTTTPLAGVLDEGLAEAGIRLLSYDASGAVLEIVTPEPQLVRGDGTRIEMAGYPPSREPWSPEVPMRRVLLATPGIERAEVRLLDLEEERIEPVEVRDAEPPPPPAVLERGEPSPDRPWWEDRPRARRELDRSIREARRRLLAGRASERRRLAGRVERTRAEPSSVALSPASSGPGAYPGWTIRLGGLAVLADRQLLPIEIAPVQVDGARRGIDVARRILVRIDFYGRREEPPGEEEDGIASRLAADPSALRIRTGREGLHRIAGSELLAAGLDPSVDPRSLSLYHLGREIAIRIEGEEDGVLDPDDELLFHAAGNPFRLEEHPVATRYTGESACWLAAGRGPGRRMASLSVAPEGALAGPADFESTLHVEEDALWFPRLDADESFDHWFHPRRLYAPAGGGHPLSRLEIVLDTPFLSGRPHEAILEVEVAGVTDFLADPDHHLVVRLNGRPVGEATWSARTVHRASFRVPSEWLLAGSNRVELSLPGDLPEVVADSVLLDYVRLEYRRRLVAEGGHLALEAEGLLAIEGFASDDVIGLELGDPAAPRLLAGIASLGGTALFAAPWAGRYLVAERAEIHSPLAIEPNVPSHWSDPSNRADWIAIVGSGLAPEIDPLVRFRESQGLRTAVVEIRDVYDEFSHGIPDPEAIRAFLRHARTSWAEPRPRYVLLVGDGSFDPRGRSGGPPDVLPVLLAQTTFLYTASDAAFAAVEGDDALPDLAIGRLPVRTPPELEALVAKIVGLESSTDRPLRATLASDNDRDYDFEGAVRTCAARAPAGVAVEVLPLAELGVTATRSRVRAAFEEGRLLVGWMGHGDTARWGSEEVLGATAAQALAGPCRVGLVTSMGCLGGSFHNLRPSLGEALVLAPGRGASAFWGSSSLAEAGLQEEVYRELLPLLLEEGRTVGQAILEAEVRAWAETGFDNDVVRTWALLGDPAARLR